MTDRTLSLEEFAVIVRGSAEPADLQYLTKRLLGQAKPSLAGIGYKPGRQWRFTADDPGKAIELLRRPSLALPEVPHVGSMTRTSRKRLA
jgi:hypothetical protein